MGRPWSEERHQKLAIKRMKEVQSGKATTRFWAGRIAEFKDRGITYQIGIYDDSIVLCADKGQKEIFRKKVRGKAFKEFVKNISEWLSFPMGYVVYKKKHNKLK
jgi:hypothetical protein